MPQQTQTFAVPGYTTDDILSMSLAAFIELRWIPKFAGPAALVGFTKLTWGQPHETVTVEAAGESVTVTSKLPESASWDLFKKNKKNLQKFATAFNMVQANTTVEKLAGWKTELETLRTTTVTAVEKQKGVSEEVEKVMNLSSGSKVITYGLIAINVLVFGVMAISGAGLFEPTNYDLVKWGANFKPYTVDQGEWWRLLSANFLHIGIIHLLFNMYALFFIGMFLEPMLGKARYTVAYLCAGLFASITSVAWHGDNSISAGASGAIFGLYGVFLALLTTNLIPNAVRKALLQSIGVFVVFNLAYGVKAGVDNAAHVGGLVSGFLIGYLYYPTLKNATPAKSNGIAGIVLFITAVVLGVIIYQS